MRHRRYGRKLNEKQIIVPIITAGLLAGILTGVIYILTRNSSSLNGMETAINSFLSDFGDASSRIDIFTESLMKHGKYIVAIWLLAFTPAGSFVSVALMFIKGAGYGYTTALLIRCYGMAGFFYGLLLYLPQNLIMLPAYFLVTYSTIHFVLLILRDKSKMSSQQFLPHLLTLLIGFACVIIASFIEAWLTPSIIAKFL